MKRFHVHLSVSDIQESIRFYSYLFAAKPALIENDYAKWMLEDPCVNFAISTRSGMPGMSKLLAPSTSRRPLGTSLGALSISSISTTWPAGTGGFAPPGRFMRRLP